MSNTIGGLVDKLLEPQAKTLNAAQLVELQKIIDALPKRSRFITIEVEKNPKVGLFRNSASRLMLETLIQPVKFPLLVGWEATVKEVPHGGYASAPKSLTEVTSVTKFLLSYSALSHLEDA